MGGQNEALEILVLSLPPGHITPTSCTYHNKALDRLENNFVNFEVWFVPL